MTMLRICCPVAGAGGCAAWLRGALCVCCGGTASRRGPPADAPHGQGAAGARPQHAKGRQDCCPGADLHGKEWHSRAERRGATVAYKDSALSDLRSSCQAWDLKPAWSVGACWASAMAPLCAGYLQALSFSSADGWQQDEHTINLSIIARNRQAAERRRLCPVSGRRRLCCCESAASGPVCPCSGASCVPD
jgi:hypothetical protein